MLVSFFSDRHKFFGCMTSRLTADADPSFRRQVAGHVETRRQRHDPAIGKQ